MRRLRVAIRLLVVVAIVFPAPVQPAALAENPAKTLALRYSPIVRLVAQAEPCGHGEPYEPTDVNVVLTNPEVALHGPWNSTNIVKVAPTAQDLSRGLFEYHLDFPGSALSPHCTYDTWSNRITQGSTPTAYARAVTEPGHPGQLALQYWFFYVFNDFNDKDEGDWEMIQLDFGAGTAAQALRTKPSQVGYSQLRLESLPRPERRPGSRLRRHHRPVARAAARGRARSHRPGRVPARLSVARL